MDLQRFKKEKTKKQTWVDWLSDVPPSASVQQEIRQKRVEQANSYTRRPVVPSNQSTGSTTKDPKVSKPGAGLSIQISFPEFRKPQFTRARAIMRQAWIELRARWRTRQVIVPLVLVAVVGLLWGSLALNKHQVDKRTAKPATTAQKKLTTGTGGKITPTFTPAVPSTKQELVTPDGTHSKFDPNKGSYSFYDTIGTKTIVVSQQQLASSSDAAAAAAKAAKSLKTTDDLKTGWGAAHMAVNAKYGSQTLVFSIRDLLVFIQSSSPFSDDQWIAYINNLQ